MKKQVFTSSDLGVEVVLLRDLPERDELVGGDFSSSHARHNGERSVALDVGEEAGEREESGRYEILEVESRTGRSCPEVRGGGAS